MYIGETRRRLGDRFREHLREVERNDKRASKSIARQFNLPNHSKQHKAVLGLSLHLGSSESRKTLEQKNLSFKSALLIPTISTSTFHSTNLFLFSCHYIPTNSVAPFSAYKLSQSTIPPIALTKGVTLETSASKLFTMANLRYQFS